MIMRRSLKAVALEYGQNTSPIVSAKAEDEATYLAEVCRSVVEAGGYRTDSLGEDMELVLHYDNPVHAFGYNWLQSNAESGRALKRRIDEVIAFPWERA